MRRGLLTAMTGCVLLLFLFVPPAAGQCKNCSSYAVDGDQRWTCATGGSGASLCVARGGSCTLSGDCCNCPPPGGGPYDTRIEILRDVSVFVAVRCGTPQPAPNASGEGDGAPTRG